MGEGCKDGVLLGYLDGPTLLSGIGFDTKEGINEGLLLGLSDGQAVGGAIPGGLCGSNTKKSVSASFNTGL